MAEVRADQVEAAEKELQAAKKASHDAPNSVPKREAYNAAAADLTDLRVRFRQQEEKAGRRTGFVSGNAANTGR